MRPQDVRRMVSACLLVLLLSAPLWAGDPLHVNIQTGPMNIQQSESHTVTTQTITGPSGTQTISTDSNTDDEQILTHSSHDADSDTTVSGPNNTGLVVQQNNYYRMPNGQYALITTNGPNNTQVNTTGAGSVQTQTQSTSTTTPNVQVRLSK